MSFLDDTWTELGGHTSSPPGRYSVRNDMWDLQYFNEMLEELREFDAERRALCEIAQDTGDHLWTDLFVAFSRVGPELVDPQDLEVTHRINQAVMGQTMDLDEYDRLKVWTEGDPVASASACITMRPALEQVYDRTRTLQKRAEELQRLRAELAAAQAEKIDLDALVAAWAETNDPTDPDNEAQAVDYQAAQEAMDAAIEKMAAEAQGQAAAFDSDLANEGAMIHALIQDGMTQAAEEAEGTAMMCRMWGLEPGELRRKPATERMALARRADTDKFRQIAEQFGPIERALSAAQRDKVTRVPEEVYDLTRGRDIEHMVPSEWSKLVDGRRVELYCDLAEGRVIQYALRGKTKVAKGGMAVMIDSSGSMEGENDSWAKAIALNLLNLCRKQKRSFWAVIFGSKGELMVFDFSRANGWSLDRVLDFIEFGFYGGTDFVSPIDAALDFVRAEFEAEGAVHSDLIMISDGQCGVPVTWKANLLAELKRIGSRMHGFSIGGRRGDQPMKELCDGRIVTVSDILDSTLDIGRIFRGLS